MQGDSRDIQLHLTKMNEVLFVALVFKIAMCCCNISLERAGQVVSFALFTPCHLL